MERERLGKTLNTVKSWYIHQIVLKDFLDGLVVSIRVLENVLQNDGVDVILTTLVKGVYERNPYEKLKRELSNRQSIFEKTK
ncbi:hypothetical protein C4579_04545 [Candidatus Microgenomates bacterium]|nr:MAG: hypothetical protein C4579_04545 [Candidatus Microgenomates bacterium]